MLQTPLIPDFKLQAEFKEKKTHMFWLPNDSREQHHPYTQKILGITSEALGGRISRDGGKLLKKDLLRNLMMELV